MSYRVGTPNYNLPQTEGADKRDWADTNQAFLAVDTALKTASDNASTAGSAASAAQSSADAAMTTATNAQTAAGTAQTSANTASELAQTAKSRADAAYTLANTANTAAGNASTQAQTADSNRGTIKVIKTATGSASKTWSTLIEEIASDVATQYAAGKHIGVRVNFANTATWVMPLTIHEPNGNWAFNIPRIFTGALLVYNVSKAGTSYRLGTWNSSTSAYTDQSGEYTSNSHIELVVFG